MGQHQQQYRPPIWAPTFPNFIKLVSRGKGDIGNVLGVKEIARKAYYQ